MRSPGCGEKTSPGVLRGNFPESWQSSSKRSDGKVALVCLARIAAKSLPSYFPRRECDFSRSSRNLT